MITNIKNKKNKDMSYLVNNQQKINDIIFADRNKSYGAYAIRSAYGNTIVKALSFMLLGFGTFISLAFYMSQKNNLPEESILPPLQDTSITITCTLKEPETKQPDQPVEQPKTPASAPSGALSTNITDSTAVTTNTTATDPLAANTGSSTGTDPLGPTTTTGTGTSTIVTTPTVDVDPVVIIPDSPPEYEGGLSALYEFLGSKLRYPEIAKEIGKEGTIYVKFVVDQYGKVGSLSLLRGLGYGLDDEALRVVAMIPKFKKPGMLNGKPVGVYFQLPIKFKLK